MIQFSLQYIKLYQMSDPYLIICAGPTGSGKGSLPSKILTYDSSLNQDPFVPIIIDSLVEENPYYRENMAKYIAMIQETEGKTDEDIIQMFLDPSKKMLEDFSTYYFTARKYTNCETGVECAVPTACNTCDAINNIRMRKAFDDGKNIVFETTGAYWPSWLFRKYAPQINLHSYRIIMAWSIVDLCELFMRNKNRAVSSLKEFLGDRSRKPPRLPDINYEPYTESLKQIIQVFKDNNSKAKLCDLEGIHSDTCVRFLLFDNNTRDPKVLYDSSIHAPEIGSSGIDQYHSDKPCKKGGSRRSRRSKKRSRRRSSRRRKRRYV